MHILVTIIIVGIVIKICDSLLADLINNVTDKAFDPGKKERDAKFNARHNK